MYSLCSDDQKLDYLNFFYKDLNCELGPLVKIGPMWDLEDGYS